MKILVILKTKKNLQEVAQKALLQRSIGIDLGSDLAHHTTEKSGANINSKQETSNTMSFLEKGGQLESDKDGKRAAILIDEVSLIKF